MTMWKAAFFYCVVVITTFGQALGSAIADEKKSNATSLSQFAKILSEHSFSGAIVEAESATVRSRINGFIRRLRFNAGDIVEAGQVLVELEDNASRFRLQQAHAALERSKVNYEIAKGKAERQARLLKRGTTPEASELEARLNLRMAKASVAEAQAAVNLAQLEFSVTRIVAPISGRISRPKFSIGDYLRPQSRPAIAKIVHVDRVLIAYEVPYQIYLQMRQISKMPLKSYFDRFEVNITLPGGIYYKHTGRPLYADVKLNTKSGSLTTWAEIPNPQSLLVFGMDVKVRINIKLKDIR